MLGQNQDVHHAHESDITIIIKVFIHTENETCQSDLNSIRNESILRSLALGQPGVEPPFVLPYSGGVKTELEAPPGAALGFDLNSKRLQSEQKEVRQSQTVTF
jgi:hypothetical protein